MILADFGKVLPCGCIEHRTYTDTKFCPTHCLTKLLKKAMKEVEDPLKRRLPIVKGWVG